MDGLPLALDQAGAYIEETGCGLATYLDLYRTDREKLLGRRGLRQLDHPESVAATWRQAFLNVEQSDPAAADLLRLCAFLAPDPIPETILTRGAPALGPALGPVVNSLAFNFTLDVVRRHSLLYRDPDTRTLTIHRLVQAVLKDNMDEQSQREWVERAVRAVGAAFPDLESEHWSRCREYLPHALACAALIEHYRLTFPEAAQLLTHAGVYLRIYAQFDQAEPLLQQALTICEHALEPGHPDIAASLNNLAVLYNDQGKYEQAKPLFQRSLAIFEKKLGPEHPYTIETRRAYADLLEKMQQAE
jgi:hypothetical protein